VQIYVVKGNYPGGKKRKTENMQHTSSITHQKLTAAGLTITAEKHQGEGDAALSLIRYSDGTTYLFDNGSAIRLDLLHGYRVDNHGEEPAWFLTPERAEEFNRGCGGVFGEPETAEADLIEIKDILLN
jgi:hypothetical protein